MTTCNHDCEPSFPSKDTLHNYIAFQLRRAQNLSFQAFARRAGSAKLSPGHFSILAIIGANHGLNQTALSHATCRDNSTPTPAIKALLNHRFIAPLRSKSGSRAYRFALTAVSQKRLDRLTAHAEAHDRRLDEFVGAGAIFRPIAVALVGLVAACAGPLHTAIVAPEKLSGAQCNALAGKAVQATRFKLPTSGAQVETAEYDAAGYCKVLGVIKPVDRAAPPIRFQVNLPTAWNGKSLQCGGGGLNGSLVSCVTALRDAPPGQTPLQRGYATFGTDAGHQNSPDKDLQSFALNDEALRNHGYAAYKKTFDIAQALIADYYGRKPKYSYYFGASEGGREALVVAQRFPEDYDGVVSVVPLVSWTGTQFGGYRQYLAAQGEGWMGPAKVALVHKATLAACDANDGLTDGMIARYIGCNATANVRALRCTEGKDSGDTCLSDAQIALVEAVRTPVPYGFAVANNEIDYPGYSTGGESNTGNMIPTVIPATRPPPGDTGKAVYAAGDVRYFYLRDPAHQGPVDWKKYEARIREVSVLMDATNPDLSAFKRRGGKLIMKSNSADFLVSPGSSWHYYEQVNATMGAQSARDFVRLYVAPWMSHFGNGRAGDGTATPDKVDLLAALEAWVEQGKAPADSLTLISYSGESAAATPVASWPMCSYPNYPHYRGSGDVKAATSYQCQPAK